MHTLQIRYLSVKFQRTSGFSSGVANTRCCYVLGETARGRLQAELNLFF